MQQTAAAATTSSQAERWFKPCINEDTVHHSDGKGQNLIIYKIKNPKPISTTFGTHNYIVQNLPQTEFVTTGSVGASRKYGVFSTFFQNRPAAQNQTNFMKNGSIDADSHVCLLQ